MWEGKSTWSYRLGPNHFVRIGEYLLPRRIEWTFDGVMGEPNAKASFEVREGRPQCVRIEVTASENGRQVRTSDLALLQVDALTATGFVRASMRSTYDPETGVTRSEKVVDERELWAALGTIEGAVKAPLRGVTKAELEQVASVYLANVDGQPTAQVREVLGYGSDRTAARRIKQAEDAGLLPSTTSGRKRGRS